MTNILPIGKQATVNMVRLFKRRLASPEELKAILSKVSEEERCLGSLPTDWFCGKTTDEEKRVLTKNIFEIFSDFAKKTYTSMYTPPKNLEHFIPELSSSLQETLKQTVSMAYKDKGLFKKVFRLKIGEKEYALSIFHSGVKNRKHGKTKEIANAINYAHAKRRRCRADFYFGKIAGEKDADGFMVTEYIPGQSKDPAFLSRTPFQYRRFCVVDEGGFNNIGNRLIDFGDIFRFYPDKETEKVAKKIMNAVLSGDLKTVSEMKKEYGSSSVVKTVLKDILDEYQPVKEFPMFSKQEQTPRQKVLDFIEKYYDEVFAK